LKHEVSSDVWRHAQSGHLETWVGYRRDGVLDDPRRAEVWESILDAVQADAPIKPGEHVLDIGCGLDTVLDFLPGVKGYTLDPLAARLAPLGLPSGIRHVSGVFEQLPFADGAFDRVFLMNVLDHVQAPVKGIAEIARVLRRGGVLVLSVDTFAGRKYWEKRLHKWWARVRGARTKHPWVFSIPEVEATLRANGLAPGRPTHTSLTKARRTFFVARRTD
jgi:SAM-dependent methyltransferase